jgi:uncharacterized protein YtpQ (UPF0354 family)
MSFFKKLFNKTKDKQAEIPNMDLQRIEVDLSKVYPRLKGIFTDDYPDPQHHKGPELEISESESPIYKPFASGLAVFYALDGGTSYQLLQNKHLSADLTIDKLHDAAMTNMAKAIADATEVNGDPKNVMMVTNGGNFEAIMMMADFLWEQLDPVFNDTICVAVPARDLLFITAKNNLVGRESLRNIIRFYFDENETPGLITRHIYERTENGWNLLETA